MATANHALTGTGPTLGRGDLAEAPTLVVVGGQLLQGTRPTSRAHALQGAADPQITIVVDEHVPVWSGAGASTVIVPPRTARGTVDPEAPTLVEPLDAPCPVPTGGGFDLQDLPTQVMPAGSGSPAPVSAARVERSSPSIVLPHGGSPAAAIPPAISGQAATRYLVVGVAGKGGMGVVHIAQDVNLLRRVALKELAPAAARNPDARSRFVREVQVTAQLDHPHIVPVYGLEVAPGDVPAYAMKLVEGRTFADLIAETRGFCERGVEPDEAHALHVRLEHFLKVCDAVGYAHERGVVHRDLKPANLMLGPHNEVYVMDWGLCRLVGGHSQGAVGAAEGAGIHGDGSETSTGAIVGTPRYMSPEQARGENETLDARSDQYSLGLILFELVTLKPAIAGATAMDNLGRAAKAAREKVQHLRDETIPPELVAIIEKSTSPEPARRYAGVADLADDLRRFMRGEAVLARPDSAWQRLVRRAVRHRQAVALGVLGLVAVSLVSVIALLLRHERALAREQREQQQLQAFMADVSSSADSMQTLLLNVRADLIALAAALGQAAEFGTRTGAPVPWLHSAGLPEGGGAFSRPAGTTDPAVDALAQRVARAGPARQRLLAGLREALGVPGHGLAGLVEMRVGFANGLAYRQPAHAQAMQDPREQAWYRAGASSGDIGWSALADDGDADVNDAQVAISAAVTGSKGDVIGVVGLVLALDEVLRSVVARNQVPAAVEAALLDHAGRVLALHRPGPTATTLEVSRTLRAPQLLEAVAADGGGVVELDAGDGPRIVVFDRLDPTDWALVVVAASDRVYVE